jgi:hypothetical protein
VPITPWTLLRGLIENKTPNMLTSPFCNNWRSPEDSLKNGISPSAEYHPLHPQKIEADKELRRGGKL